MTRRKTLSTCIQKLMGEGMLVPLYFVAGINSLKERCDAMSDEELRQAFNNLFPPAQIRSDINYIVKTLNNFTEIKGDLSAMSERNISSKNLIF